ncbi:conserved hypothetical protein [Candidatus Terasakiella magnetica]|uniref:Uncharacterized protein n=2 Tax=Candidatus Terasakiella magnetica TaxID=1867952 RepID=A0A1C3RF67_9PROT|nr:conserved hypothetical protein [Candidatus Terasakiella magnetica]
MNHSQLKALFDEKKEVLKENDKLRIHRTLSWFGRAEGASDDEDAAFIFCWIAFNSIYAQEKDYSDISNEKASFGDFFEKVVGHDDANILYMAIWEKFSQSIRLLMNNQYVYQPFWHFQNGVEGYEDWENRFQKSIEMANRCLVSKDTKTMLSLVFDRLYVLRNQIMHGGATWNSRVNRQQIQDGHKILEFMLPKFIEIIINHPEEDWGKPIYPVVSS